MIKHIVMFKVKAQSSEEKTFIVNNLKNMLDQLKQIIKEIQYLETGINFSARNTAYDLVLITEFLNREDLQIYITDPDHRRVAEYIDTIREQTAVVDYEY